MISSTGVDAFFIIIIIVIFVIIVLGVNEHLQLFNLLGSFLLFHLGFHRIKPSSQPRHLNINFHLNS